LRRAPPAPPAASDPSQTSPPAPQHPFDAIAPNETPMLLKSLVVLTFLAAHGLPASHHPPDHHEHIAHRALDAEIDSLSQELEAEEFKRLMEGELERAMGPLESELQECYKIAGDLAGCDFKETEKECNAQGCNAPIAAPTFGHGDDKGAKVKQWTKDYLEAKTNECKEKPKPVVYFGCCHCNDDADNEEQVNVKGCQKKCENPEQKAFQLFSDGTMKIHDCTKAGTDRVKTIDSPNAFGYLPGMTDKGVSSGEPYKGGIKIEKINTKGWSTSTIALNLGGTELHGTTLPESGLVIGCSHGCAPTPSALAPSLRPSCPRRSHAAPSRRSQHEELGDVQVVQREGPFAYS
jgi:hypothetical protein